MDKKEKKNKHEEIHDFRVLAAGHTCLARNVNRPVSSKLTERALTFLSSVFHEGCNDVRGRFYFPFGQYSSFQSGTRRSSSTCVSSEHTCTHPAEMISLRVFFLFYDEWPARIRRKTGKKQRQILKPRPWFELGPCLLFCGSPRLASPAGSIPLSTLD